MKLGYARVSTQDQKLALQEDALSRAGCDAIFRDEGISGGQFKRPALDRLLATVRPGDVLVIWRLDRLGRSLSHLILLVSMLREKDVGFVSICEAIDTETASGRLLFHIMGALAEFERAMIGERTRAGLEAAKLRGKTLGRPRALEPAQVDRARAALQSRATTLTELAARMQVSRPTLARAVKRRATS